MNTMQHAGRSFEHLIHTFLDQGARGFVLAHAFPIAFLVAHGELAIGVALVSGILVRTASFCGLIFMPVRLFSSNYPGSNAPFWQYFGASLSHSVLAPCFAAFVFGDADQAASLRPYLHGHRGRQKEF
jgi:uncharacterized membrane protein YphA (DoxX/SURF4 family)